MDWFAANCGGRKCVLIWTLQACKVNTRMCDGEEIVAWDDFSAVQMATAGAASVPIASACLAET